MLGRILLACVSLFLVLVLTETQTWAIYNCYDYVFFRLTGKDAHPQTASDLSPDIAKYWPGCIVPINGLACVEEVMRQKGTYAGKRPMHTSQPLPHLAPGDVIYLPIGHIVYVEDYNYSKDPNADMTPRDAPILSHWLPIPGNYYGADYTTIDVSKVAVYKYGMHNSTAERAGGFSYRDTFKILLVKEHMTETGYDLYKKLRLDLILDVKTYGDKAIEGAEVVVAGRTLRTGKKGAVTVIELKVDDYANKELPILIRKTGYVEEKRTMLASQMVPSADFLRYTVNLEAKDLDALIRELEAQLEKKRQGLNPVCTDINSAYKAIMALYLDAREMYINLNNLKPKADKALADCGKAAGLRSQIRASAGAAETKSATLNGLIDQANAVVCNTSRDEARLRALWGQIHPLSWDVYNNAVKADTLNRNLQTIIDQANVVYAALNPDPAAVLTGTPLLQVEGMKAILDKIKDRKAKALDPAMARMDKLRPECEKAHDDACLTVQQAADAQGIPADPRVAAFVSRVQSKKPRIGTPCDEHMMSSWTDWMVKTIGNEEPKFRKRIEDMRKMPLCAGQRAEDDAVARSKAAWPVIQKLADSHLIVKMDNCKAALSKKPAAPAPAASATKPLPPPGPVLLLIEGPTEAFVGDRMNFKAVIVDKQYASDILRPDGAYAMYWYVDDKRRGDMQYYSDTVNFVAATVGPHKLKVEFVWGSPKTGKVTRLGWKEIQVTIKKKESQDYANVSVPHGKWVPTGLSVKKGDVITIEAKGAYTARDGSQIGPEGGGHWGFWTLAVRYGKTVHLPGRGNTYYAEEGGDVELGTPRSGGETFVPEDIANLQGALTVRVTVKRKTP
jgi:hypothetical protein